MKKLFAILLAAMMTVTLTACAGQADAPETTSENFSSAETKPKSSSIPESELNPETESTPAQEPEATTEYVPTPMPDMTVESAGITDGAMALTYGAKGEQFVKGTIPSQSLPLTVRFVPEGTAVLALTMIDPDGGDWVHWLACNIPVTGTDAEIPENASIDWAEQIVQGKNSFGSNGYGGPTPPSGVHTYVITVYALSETLTLDEGFRLADLTAAMEGKVLAEAIVSGTYAH